MAFDYGCALTYELMDVPNLTQTSQTSHGGVLLGLYKFHKKGLIKYRVGITVGVPVLNCVLGIFLS